MGYRCCSDLRGRRGFGGSDPSVQILCQYHFEEADHRHRSLRVSGDCCGLHSCKLFRSSDYRSVFYARVQVYRLYHVWKPHWWLCIVPSLAWIGVWGMRFFVFAGEQEISPSCSVSTGFLIWTMTKADLSSGVGVFQRKVGLWITSSFASTIA